MLKFSNTFFVVKRTLFTPKLSKSLRFLPAEASGAWPFQRFPDGSRRIRNGQKQHALTPAAPTYRLIHDSGLRMLVSLRSWKCKVAFPPASRAMLPIVCRVETCCPLLTETEERLQ